MYIGLIIFLLLGVFLIWTYNGLVKKKLFTEEAYSGIDVQLKKRYNLIPNLLETVKGYVQHEKDTFTSVVNARNSAISAEGINEQQQAENNLSSSLLNLFALAEQYPELRASENFKYLQEELVNIEDDIEKSRRYYNGTVREYNIKVAVFPSSIIANLFKFRTLSFFEMDIRYKELPKISFS